ncbi:hypothetical protein Tco_1544815 [Tanacetum coccineum]
MMVTYSYSYGLLELRRVIQYSPNFPLSEWLLDGLAGFLTDSFVKQSLGNNEARYRRYKMYIDDRVEKIRILYIEKGHAFIIKEVVQTTLPISP